MKQLFVVVFLLVSAISAHAQDFGFVAGIGNTSASIDGADVNAEMGYRVGLNIKMDLMNQVSFRTGATYTARPFNIKDTASNTDLDVKLSYIDIPALFQFQFTDMFSVFAGPVVGINSSKKGSGTLVGANVDGDIDDMKSIYLLAQVGVNLNFDGIGFDFYYERGLGDIWKDGAKDYSVMGANFIYWF